MSSPTSFKRYLVAHACLTLTNLRPRDAIEKLCSSFWDCLLQMLLSEAWFPDYQFCILLDLCRLLAVPLAPVQRVQQRQSAALLQLRQFLLPGALRGQHPARPKQGAGVLQA